EDGGMRWKIHSTTMQPVGTRVGMTIVPYNIHVMHRADMTHTPYSTRVAPDNAPQEEEER
ncbi:MAG: hypothetical protein IJH38_00360, partial [Clostridia bacterium]|nr:hypothetical protein [Clostridia bacterium]